VRRRISVAKKEERRRMPMADLETQVRNSASDLRTVCQTAGLRPAGISLPAKCYEEWETIASLHASLTEAIPLFEGRSKAWDVMESLVSSDRASREAQRSSRRASSAATASPDFTFDGVPMDFPMARHLAATGYVCLSWSLYDRLANVCGRLASSKDIPDDPWQDPKLWGNLMGGGSKTLGGFLIQQPLAEAYGWPTAVAYKIRNWLIHDGGDVGRKELFKGTDVSNGYILHANAITDLEKCCKYKCETGQISRCCLAATEEPWQTRDLLQILEKYHGEIDTMLTCLVKWTVDSMVGQLSTFSERDMQVLVQAATAVKSSKS
jgi:hypothetical protein